MEESADLEHLLNTKFEDYEYLDDLDFPPPSFQHKRTIDCLYGLAQSPSKKFRADCTFGPSKGSQQHTSGSAVGSDRNRLTDGVFERNSASRKRKYDDSDSDVEELPVVKDSRTIDFEPVKAALTELIDDSTIKQYLSCGKVDGVKKVEVFLPKDSASYKATSIDCINSFALREMEVLARMEDYTTPPQPLMPPDLIATIHNVSLSGFELLIKNFGDIIGPDNLIGLVDHFLAQCSPGDDPKLTPILKHGLYPQLCDTSSTRKLYPTFKKLLDLSEDAVMEDVLVPMLVHKGLLLRPLYSDVNLKKLLGKLLECLIVEMLPFGQHSIAAVNFCLEKETEVPERPLDQLFEVLKHSSGHVMNEKLASFYFAIMKRFLTSMSKNQLLRMYTLNTYNQSIGNSVVDKMVRQRLATLEEPVPQQLQQGIVDRNHQLCIWNPDSPRSNYSPHGNGSYSGGSDVDMDED